MHALLLDFAGGDELHHLGDAAALGMDEELGVGMGGALGADVVGPDAGVDVALARPDVHRVAGLALDVGAEPHVGAEEDLGLGAVLAQDVLDDLDRVGGGAAVVGLRLDLGRGVDVHHDDRVGAVARLPVAQLARGDRVGERAAGVEVGDQHRLVGREDRSRLGHEVDAAEGDHRSAGGGRLTREPERVAGVIGDFLHLGHLVVVGEDHGVALARQLAHLARHLLDLLRAEVEHRDRLVDRRQLSHFGCLKRPLMGLVGRMFAGMALA